MTLLHLICLGYRVYFDDDAQNPIMSDIRKKRIQSMVNRSVTVIFFADSSFQNNPSCMYTLECVTKSNLKPVNIFNNSNIKTNQSSTSNMDDTTANMDIVDIVPIPVNSSRSSGSFWLHLHIIPLNSIARLIKCIISK